MKTFKVNVDGQVYTVKVEEINQSDIQTRLDLKTTKLAQDKSDIPVSGKNHSNEQAPEIETGTQGKQGESGIKVEAPMPGAILEVKVDPGDSVKEGDVLLVFEAMKMENELTAPRAGTVTDILVKKGDSVNSGDPLVVLTP